MSVEGSMQVDRKLRRSSLDVEAVGRRRTRSLSVEVGRDRWRLVEW